MLVEKTKAEIKNVNPRKEPGEDGKVLASDISVEFSVPRAIIDKLFPVKSFTEQFYSGDDTRLEMVFPINYGERVEGLKATLKIGNKNHTFSPARFAADMKLTPLVGQHVQVNAKLQVYPTRMQSGLLDDSANDFVDLSIEPLNRDIDD